MLIQVLSLTQEQINALPDQERAAVQQLVSVFLFHCLLVDVMMCSEHNI